MSLRRQLEKMNESLGPREAVIVWLKEAQEFGSLLTYMVWLRQQPEDAWPLLRLTRHVTTTAGKRLRGQKPEEMARTREQAERSAIFLLALVVTANAEVARREEQLREEVLRLLCACPLGAYQALAGTERLREEFLHAPARPTRGELPRPGAAVDTLSGLAAAIRQAHLRALVLEQSVRVLSTRYVKGEDLLFPDLRSRLELITRTLGELAATNESLRATYPETAADLRKQLLGEALGRRHARPSANPASDVFGGGETTVTDTAVQAAEHLLLLAKAEAHTLLGKTHPARLLLGRYLERYVAGGGSEEVCDPSGDRPPRSSRRQPRTRSTRHGKGDPA